MQLKPWELDGYERLRREAEMAREMELGGQEQERRNERVGEDGEGQDDSRASWGLKAVQTAKKIGASRAGEMDSVESFGFMGNGQGIGHGLVHSATSDIPGRDMKLDGPHVVPEPEEFDGRPPWERMVFPALETTGPVTGSPLRAVIYNNQHSDSWDSGGAELNLEPLNSSLDHFNTYPRSYPQPMSFIAGYTPTRSPSAPSLPSQSHNYGNAMQDIELGPTPGIARRPAPPFDPMCQDSTNDRPVTHLHPQPPTRPQAQPIATIPLAGLDDILASASTSASNSYQSKDVDSQGHPVHQQDYVVTFGPEQVVQDPILRRYYESIIRDILVCMIICTSGWIALCLAVPLRGLPLA